MRTSQTHHATFVIERTLRASPARVFAAFSTLAAKNLWFGAGGSFETLDRTFEFRPGGAERFRARWTNGRISDFQATYRDIVENERMVLVYDMWSDDQKLSVSLLTIELFAEGGGTRLVHTEHGGYFVGGAEAAASREHGSALNLDHLVRQLEAA